MPETQKLAISEVIQDMGSGLDRHRSLILRMTVVFAALNAATSLLNITGAAGTAVSAGVLLLLSAGYGGMITALLCLPQPGESAGELWAVVAPVLARIIWVTLITIVAVLAGLMILVVPGLILLTVFAVATQAVVVEHAGAFAALDRSFNLVRGNGLRVFLFILTLGLICLILISLTAIVAILLLGKGSASTAASAFLQNLIAGPLLAIGPAVLYNHLTRGVEIVSPPVTEDGSL